MRKLFSAATTAALLSLAASPIAHGAVPATAARSLTSPSIVFYGTCDSYPVTYDLEVPEYTASWSADLHVIGPDGLEAGAGFVYGEGERAVGTEKIQICGNPKPGRYDLRADVEACDDDYDCSQYEITGTSFKGRLPRSKTTMGVRGGKRLAFTVRVKDERPRGMFPSDEYTDVILQKKKGKRWVRVGKAYTNSKGIARVTVRNGPGRERFRAVAKFDSYESIADSVSRPVTVR